MDVHLHLRGLFFRQYTDREREFYPGHHGDNFYFGPPGSGRILQAAFREQGRLKEALWRSVFWGRPGKSRGPASTWPLTGCRSSSTAACGREMARATTAATPPLTSIRRRSIASC